MNLAKRLYELQQIDVEVKTQQELLDDINRRLGENEELEEARSTATQTKEQLLHTTTRRKELEWEVDDLGKNVKQISDKLYGGTVKNPKELVNLEQEVNSFKEKLRQTEDTLLDVMADNGVYKDDSQIADLRIYKTDYGEKGTVTIAVKELEDGKAIHKS